MLLRRLRNHASNGGFSLHYIVLAFLLVGVIGAIGYGVYRHESNSPSSSTALLNSFRVSGNEIISPNNKIFVPYGVVIECAAMKLPTNQLCTGNDYTGNSASAMLEAAAKDWKMNIVRFQVAQENLFSGPKGAVNQTYLTMVDDMVKQANSLGMIAILTLQEEEYSGPDFPTATAVSFWKYIANYFKGYPYVFFDLYNEPRLAAQVAGSDSNLWNIWRNGGEAGGVDYVGMQSLVSDIRSEGANNIIIAEGPNHDKDLSGLPTDHLIGTNIAYGVEPNLKGHPTKSSQYSFFGQYAKTWKITPEAFLDNYGTQSCDPNSPVDLPALLSYLKSLNMGLIFWSLNQGVGIVGKNLDDPTSYPPNAKTIASVYCPLKIGSADYNGLANTIGPGAIIKAFYNANSIQLGAYTHN